MRNTKRRNYQHNKEQTPVDQKQEEKIKKQKEEGFFA